MLAGRLDAPRADERLAGPESTANDRRGQAAADRARFATGIPARRCAATAPLVALVSSTGALLTDSEVA